MICITLAPEAVGFGAFSVFCRLGIGIGELLLCTSERLIEEQIRRHHQSAGLNLKTESEAMWSPDTVCVLFGDAQDAAYLAQEVNPLKLENHNCSECSKTDCSFRAV